MSTPLVIIGCGGFGREVHDIVDAINGVKPTWNLLGYLDDQPDPANVSLVEDRSSEVLGSNGLDDDGGAGSPVCHWHRHRQGQTGH